MPGVIIRGRAAWVAGLVFGLILVIIGVVIGSVKGWAWSSGLGGWLVGVGAAFAVFGGIFLIMSIATKGQTD